MAQLESISVARGTLLRSGTEVVLTRRCTNLDCRPVSDAASKSTASWLGPVHDLRKYSPIHGSRCGSFHTVLGGLEYGVEF